MLDIFRFRPQPSFLKLCRSSLAPNDGHARDIRPSIAAIEAEILVLEQKLSTEDSRKHPRLFAIGQRQLKRDKRFLLKLRAILSPARLLPPEIIEEIFRHTGATETIFPFNIAALHSLSGGYPWAISQVCRQWRNVALSMSTLWAHLPTINLDCPKFIRHPERHLEFWAEMLSRSRNSSIAFHLCCAFENNRNKPVFDLLVLHSERWQTVSVDMPIGELKALAGAKHRLQALRTLRWTGTEDEGVCDVFSDAPQLQNVLIFDPLVHHSELILPDLARVNHQQMGGNVDGIIQAIKYSYSSLQSLEFSHVVFELHHRLEEVVTLPCLSVLRISYVRTEQEFPQSLLDCLCTPALEELRVRAEDSFIFPSLQNLFSRSKLSGGSLPLAKLYLRTLSNPGELTQILRFTPLLTHLNTTWPHSSDMSSLFEGKGNTWTLVPDLQCCTFTISDDISKYPVPKLVESVRTRLCALCIIGPGLYRGAGRLVLKKEILAGFEWARGGDGVVYIPLHSKGRPD